MGEFLPGLPGLPDGISQVKVCHLAVGPGGSARACGEGETCIPGGQLISGTRAETVHERKYDRAATAGFMTTVDPVVTSTIITTKRNLPCRGAARSAPGQPS